MPYTAEGAGYKRTDTSKAAAEAAGKKSANLRERIVVLLAGSSEPLSVEQIAEKLNHDPQGVRPRITELRALGRVEDSGERGKTRLGKSCIKWKGQTT